MAKEYRNAIRSRKSIRAAYADLVFEKKDASKITVKEIVDKADISKSTFYCHYKDIDDLVNEIENELLSNAKEELDLFCNDQNPDIRTYIARAVDVVKKNERDYKMITSGIYPTDFIFKYKKLVIESMNSAPYFKTRHPEKEIRHAEIAFFCSGFVDTVVGYLQGMSYMSLEDNIKIGIQFIMEFLENK